MTSKLVTTVVIKGWQSTDVSQSMTGGEAKARTRMRFLYLKQRVKKMITWPMAGEYVGELRDRWNRIELTLIDSHH
jgi:hypothetical protein